MPKSKKEGIFLSLIMSLVMIYVMAALNNDVKQGEFSVYSWKLAFERLPLGYLVGIICDLFICTPLSRKITASTAENAPENVQVFILRFCMVVLMTFFMTIFGIAASGETLKEGTVSFFKYFPYNFTMALPIQMLIAAPLSAKAARCLANVKKQTN